MDQAIEILKDNAEHARSLPSKEDLRLNRRAGDRNRNITLIGVALIAVAALVFSSVNNSAINDTAAATAINTGSIKALNDARDQLRAAGVPESQLPPPVVINQSQPIDVDALVNATAATILAKIRTDPTYRGAAGLQGDVGPIGPGGVPGAAPACLATPTACQGADGKPGAPGAPGIDGSQGPKGDQGDQGIQGIQGVQGIQGLQGDKGDAGDAGGPFSCPDGYSMKGFTVQGTTGDDELLTQDMTILACVAN